MGFGANPEEFNQAMLNHVKNDFSGSLIQIAEALRLPLDEVTADGEFGVAMKDKKIAAGLIPAGTVAALRITVSGMRSGNPLLRFRANWYCSSDLDKAWELLE